MQVLWAHLQDEPPDLPSDRDDVPPRFRTVWRAALAKEPTDRPRTSVEYMRALSEAAGMEDADAVG